MPNSYSDFASHSFLETFPQACDFQPLDKLQAAIDAFNVFRGLVAICYLGARVLFVDSVFCIARPFAPFAPFAPLARTWRV